MSTLTTETLSSAVVGELTTSLIPTVTRVDARLEISSVSVVLAVSIVFILSPITVSGNSVILAAFYKYKRLRTASNCLLVSLAVSDFGVGVFMPFGIHLELSGLPENGVSTLCIAPYCIVIALCSASVLVTVAIAVDRLTSLAQPLRYKNIITHSSIEKYIAAFWIYAIAVGLSPLIYAQIAGITQPHSGTCRFGAAVLPPVRVFLVVAVWAPSALVLLGCYMYVYLVARAHARAIYTVELSFRNQTQTLALPRYGQTLAITVGAFLVLWLPFQTCMLLDIFCGTNILSDWSVVWLGLPILAHSGANPWIYAFHHGEMRVAAGKIAEDIVALFGIMPSRYGCSPARRGSNTNFELAEVNNSNEARRHAPENCFAAKQHGAALYPGRKCLEASSRHADISPEREALEESETRQADIVEEDIHDLTKMLDPRYIIDRNHVIDSNHNIDKIKNLKYLLDPTFNKIRHLRKLNHKRRVNCGKSFPRFIDPKFISYQNLKSDGGASSGKLTPQLNAMSDPVLNADSPTPDAKDYDVVLRRDPVLGRRRNSNLASMSDPDIKAGAANASSEISLRLFPTGGNAVEAHRCSVQNLEHSRCAEHSLARHAMHCRQLETRRKLNGYVRPRTRPSPGNPGHGLELRLREASVASLPTPEGSTRWYTRGASRRNFSPNTTTVTITANRLANLCHREHSTGSASCDRRADVCGSDPAYGLTQARRNLEILRHSESINVIEPMNRSRLPEPCGMRDTLGVPVVHSEPPSPVEPLPLDSLQEEDTSAKSFEPSRSPTRSPTARRGPRSPVGHSDPVIPSVLLNIEDCSDTRTAGNPVLTSRWANGSPIDPHQLNDALLLRNSERTKLQEPVFTEHDSTRFSSRRPSDSKWSESSRSQEVLSNVTGEHHHHAFQSSYSASNLQNCTSGSDLNDASCLDPFACPDAISSSLRESFFSAPSVPDSDIFASFEEENDASTFAPEPEVRPSAAAAVHSSGSSSSLRVKCGTRVPRRAEIQSRSTESVCRRGGAAATATAMMEPRLIARLEASLRRGVFAATSGRTLRLAPLAVPTPTEICSPGFDVVSEMKSESSVGVRV